MHPIHYGDGKRASGSTGRPLMAIPGMDMDYYPELDAGNGGLESFGEMQGMFRIPLPLGFPYMDYVTVDMPNNVRGYAIFPLSEENEFFILESIMLTWPSVGAGAFPDTGPAGAPSPIPQIQISSSDPNRRRGHVGTGPQMFYKPMSLNHISAGPGNPSTTEAGSGALFQMRRVFPFSPRDKISIEIVKPSAAAPRWVGVGIAGRMVTETFLQGIIG